MVGLDEVNNGLFENICWGAFCCNGVCAQSPTPPHGVSFSCFIPDDQGPPTSPPCLSHFHYDLRLFLNYPVWESYSIDINAF